jgi:FkbM family methyltransferase
MRLTNINGEWDIILPDHRADRPEWDIKNGGWEKARLSSIYSKVKPGDIFYYIGAEEMDMCGLIAKWGAELVVVEPNPKVWPNGKAIWDANSLTPPLACFVGFASSRTDIKNEPVCIGTFPECANGPVIGDHGFKELYQEADVIPEIMIDDLVVTTGKPPKHISIDVEGSEFEVLKGAEKTLIEYKPTLWISIHPEFMFHQFGQYSSEFRGWIKGKGYQETILDYQHELHCLYTPI